VVKSRPPRVPATTPARPPRTRILLQKVSAAHKVRRCFFCAILHVIRMFLPTLKSGLGFGDSGSGTKGLGTRHGSQKFIAYVEDPGRRYPFDCARDVRQFCSDQVLIFSALKVGGSLLGAVPYRVVDFKGNCALRVGLLRPRSPFPVCGGTTPFAGPTAESTACDAGKD
jgi:hypothetical protein